jgi:hypothetical protein
MSLKCNTYHPPLRLFTYIITDTASFFKTFRIISQIVPPFKGEYVVCINVESVLVTPRQRWFPLGHSLYADNASTSYARFSTFAYLAGGYPTLQTNEYVSHNGSEGYSRHSSSQFIFIYMSKITIFYETAFVYLISL